MLLFPTENEPREAGRKSSFEMEHGRATGQHCLWGEYPSSATDQETDIGLVPHHVGYGP